MQSQSNASEGFRFVRSAGFYVVKHGSLSAPHRVMTLKRLAAANKFAQTGDADARQAW
jgi:hypothetical protein